MGEIYYTTKPSLEDHKRHKKRLIAPWNKIQDLPLMESSWHLHRLPEVFWIGELIHFLGNTRSLDILSTITKSAFEARQIKPNGIPVFASYWNLEIEDIKSYVQRILFSENMNDDISKALHSLAYYYPKYPLSFLCNEETDSPNPNDTLGDMKKRISTLSNRFSRFAVKVHGHICIAEVRSGQLVLPEEMDLAQVEPIYDSSVDRESEKFANAAGFVRSMAGSSFAAFSSENNSHTSRYFWNRGLEIEPCQQ